MTINLTVPQTMQELRPRITVVGVGGAGCNAVNNMIDANLEGVDFLVANTDGQSLAHSMASRKLQLGTTLTGGLGAGSKPEMGRKAAEESLDDVMAELADSNMVFITAGMGGGTGTGAAPVIAKAARERGILTVGVVTKPFDFEGKRRMEQADEGIQALQAYVDTLIVIPNQNLFRLANERTTLADTFHMADAVLHQGVCGVTDLMIKPGLINLDFADIRAVMSEMGKAMMGTGEASGETRAIEAAEAAINNPLLDDTSMKGAKAVLINITGGMDMTLFEVDEAANRIRSEVEPDAVIIFGSAFDEKLEGVMRVSVVATGIESMEQSSPLPFVNEPVTMPAQPVLQTPATTARPQMRVEAASQPVAASPFQTASADKLNEEVSAISDADDAVLAEQAPAMETPEAAEMPLMEKTKIQPEEQLDIEAAVNSAVASDHKMAQETSDVKEIPEAAEQPEVTAEEVKPSSQTASHEQATIIRRPLFVPDAPRDVGLDEELFHTEPVPEEAQRSSLINRISGLWASKTDSSAESTEPAPAKEEPQLSRSNLTLPTIDEPAIMDLPKADMVQTSLPVDPVTKEEYTEDDDLDIPAFLRRQAN
ncbi:MAG: cell division protein FtsZ [Candidatus Puniceispirillaceae bacterium]